MKKHVTPRKDRNNVHQHFSAKASHTTLWSLFLLASQFRRRLLKREEDTFRLEAIVRWKSFAWHPIGSIRSLWPSERRHRRPGMPRLGRVWTRRSGRFGGRWSIRRVKETSRVCILEISTVVSQGPLSTSEKWKLVSARTTKSKTIC